MTRSEPNPASRSIAPPGEFGAIGRDWPAQRRRCAGSARAIRPQVDTPWNGLHDLEPRLLLAPDLVTSATGTGVEGARYFHGQTITASATITNEGFPGSGPFNMQFWISRNGVTSKYLLIETDRVTVGLAPLTSRTNFINGGLGFVLPDTLPFGDYHITAYADTSNEVTESDETNNFGKTNNFRIVGPDLVVREVTGTDSFYDAGGLLNAAVLIANDGDTLTNSGPFQLRYYLSTPTNPTFMLIEEGGVANVLQGVPTSDVINVPGWRIPTDIPQGQYHITVFLDTGGSVKELNESNNFGTSASFIIGRPNLQVPSVTLLSPSGVYAYNDPLSAIAAIDNIGLGSTFQQAPLGFNVSYYLGDADAATDARRMVYPLQQAFVARLDGSDSTTDILNTLIVPALQPGEYRLWVRVDSNDNVLETHEGDNWGSSNVLTIQGARWEDAAGNVLGDTIQEAVPVYLAVYTAQVTPAQTIPVNIWEDDLGGDGANDLIESVALSHVASPGQHKWMRRWVPYRVLDAATKQNDAEYFFRVVNEDHLPGLFDASENLSVDPHPGDFGVLLVGHTVGTGVPLVLVHGNESEEAPDLYRWKGLLNRIESHPQDFAEFDVYLWKHNTETAVGFNGAAGSQADGLADYIYGTLGVGQPGPYENVKVAIIAHSQGGLVSRGFMNTFNPQRGHLQGEDVSTLITLGTPHHGSPFGTEDWVAALWADLFHGTNEAGFNLLQQDFLQHGNGDLNLAWDNMDGVVDRAFPAGFLFDPDAYVLTPRDTNRVSSFPDPTVVYLDGLKAQFGTLEALNANDRFRHKLVTFAAYDADLSNNMTAQQFSTALLTGQVLSRHEQLSAVANLMSQMSGEQLGNDNPSDYLANDGLVPLQSALLLDLPATGLSIATRQANDAITLDAAAIAAAAPRDVLRFIYSTAGDIQDHLDLLDTTRNDYWNAVTARVRAVLETTPPTASLVDPGPGATIALVPLNQRGYLDIAFADVGGSTLDPAAILDDAPEFTLAGPAAAGVTLVGPPSRLGDEHVYRFAFTGQFTEGDVTVNFLAGAFADDAGNLSAPAVAAFEVVADLVPPTVTGVLVRGSAWSGAFLDHLAVAAMGQGGYAIPTGSQAQSAPMPWSHLDTLVVRFSEPVVIDESRVRLRGVNGPAGDGSTTDYALISGAFQAGLNLAAGAFEAVIQLDLDAGIPADRLLLTIEDAVTDLSGNALDGEWLDHASTASGNGTTGGDFAFRFNVLPGDVNRSAKVLVDDAVIARNVLGQSPGGSGFNPMADIDGSGANDPADVQAIRLRQFHSLPDSQPSPSAEPIVAESFIPIPLVRPRPRASMNHPIPAALHAALAAFAAQRPDWSAHQSPAPADWRPILTIPLRFRRH